MSSKRQSPDSPKERARKSALAILKSRRGSGISEEEADALAAEARSWARRGNRKNPKPRD